MTIEELKTHLLQLPQDVRAEMAYTLLQSLDEGPDVETETDLLATLQRREREILDGTAVGIPAAEVFARLKEKHS